MRCCGMLAAVHVCVQQFAAPANMFTRISAHQKAAQAPTCCTDLPMQLKAELVTCCGRCNNPAGLQMPQRHRGEACTEKGSAKEATLCAFLAASFRIIPVASCSHPSGTLPWTVLLTPNQRTVEGRYQGSARKATEASRTARNGRGSFGRPFHFCSDR